MSLEDSPHVNIKKTKTVLDSGFQAVESWIPGTGFRILRQWKLDFGYQYLVVLRIPQTKISQIPRRREIKQKKCIIHSGQEGESALDFFPKPLNQV